jgi:hypothetical protein
VAAVGVYPVVVRNPGPPPNNDSNSVNFTVARPATAYVNKAWAGTPVGTSPDASSKIFGYDAFAVIQSGLDAVDSPGTVAVYPAPAPGYYAENLVIARPATLYGLDRDIVVVVPDISAPNPCTGSTLCGGAASTIILVQADNVTIRDLTLDGNNPTRTSGIVRGDVDLDARNGIVVNNGAGTFNGLEVRDCTVRNIYLRGVNATTGGTFSLHDNIVTNVQGDYYSIGIFAYGGPGTMASNTVSYCNDAVSANHSKGIQFLNNTVSHSASGIHTDNSGDGGGVADLIKGNTVTDGTAGGYGIWTFASGAPWRQHHYRSTWGSAEAGGGTPPAQHGYGNHAAGSVGVYATTDLGG